MFSTDALCSKTHIGMNFNQLVLFNLRPSVLDSAAFKATILLDNYGDSGERKQGAGVQ